MPYVRRDLEGQVSALLQAPEADAQEFLPSHHPEIAKFLDKPIEPELFDKLDEDLIRVLEDLIDVLINKNLLRLTDLPEAAREKLLSRKNLRQHLSQHRLNNLIDSDQGLI